jgi:hypothetical protein
MSEKIIYDVRVIEHLIRRGEVTQGQLQDYLKALGDDAELGETTETTFEAHYALRSQNTKDEEANLTDIQEN